MAAKRYPIGIQTFERLRSEGYLYIDKTALVHRLAHENGSYFFLCRPRRFGKSLLTSTLASYFEGRRDLFKGLAIEGMETEWTAYPVLHFDFSSAKYTSKEKLLESLDYLLSKYEKVWKITNPPRGANNRLSNLIETAKEKTGKQVVVLIDEYDAPLLDVAHQTDTLNELRNIMRDFYSPLKANEPNLKFVFLTGITKFSQLSIFSELNNIQNISMRPDYAAICGITKEEVRQQMAQDVNMLATALHKSDEDVVEELTRYYDGYHFTWPSPDIFNPYSLLNAFSAKSIQAYWFATGTPTYLLEMMRKFDFLPSQFGKTEAKSTDFDAPTEGMTDIMPLLYQSGYLTIKDYDSMFYIYTLDIPNREVELGLMESFIPNYIMADTKRVNVTVADMARALYKGDMDKTLRQLQAFLATVPYTDHTNYEGHYQQILCIIFKLLGAWADVEVHTPKGRVDIVMTIERRLYVIELKLDASAKEAMNQIDLRNYAAAFSTCGYPIIKVAVNFDSNTRNISDWKISPNT